MTKPFLQPLSRTALQEKLFVILQETFEFVPNQLTLETRLAEDLDLDSIDLVELAMQLQDLVNKDFQVDELRDVKTLQDVVDALVVGGAAT